MYPHLFPHPAKTSDHLIVTLDTTQHSETAYVYHDVAEAKSFLIDKENQLSCLELWLTDNPEWNLLLDYFKLRSRLGMPLRLKDIILNNPTLSFQTTLQELGYHVITPSPALV